MATPWASSKGKTRSSGRAVRPRLVTPAALGDTAAVMVLVGRVAGSA
jgi:hypothetical protein